MFWFFYKNESKVDSHIAKPTIDMFQIFNINLIELGGEPFYTKPPRLSVHNQHNVYDKLQ